MVIASRYCYEATISSAFRTAAIWGSVRSFSCRYRILGLYQLYSSG